MRINLIFCLLCIVTFGTSQDSTDMKLPIEYEVLGKHILANTVAPLINGFGQTLADNPINHFAIYSGITLKPNYKNKYSADIGIYFEERNHSGGNYTLSHLVSYPKITFGVIDTLHIAKSKIKFDLTAGDLWDEEFNDILRIYNIDFHGFISKVGYNNFWLSLFKISDLSYSIGLGLNELEKFELLYRTKKSSTALNITRNTLDLNPRYDYNYGIYSKISLTSNSKLKLQIERRENSRIGNGFALAAEYQLRLNSQKLKFKYQYYSSNYNSEYFS